MRDLIRERAGRGTDDRHRVGRRGRAGREGLHGAKAAINCTHGTVIRLLPAMTLSEAQAHEGCDILAEVLKTLAG